jgi:sporulation protein YlmC with PRC-barrel domain
MRIVLRTAALAVAVAAAAAAAAPAQTALPAGTVEPASLANTARASKLIGSKVYKGDDAVGQIDDVLIDMSHAGVPALVLSVGGFIGIGEKRVAIPLSAIKVGTEARFITDLTKEDLQKAPAFDYGKLK